MRRHRDLHATPRGVAVALENAMFSVAGVLVHTRPGSTDELALSIARLPGAVVHAAAPGRLVLTLEASDPAAILARLTEIQRLEGVLSAALVSEHSEPLHTIDEELTA